MFDNRSPITSRMLALSLWLVAAATCGGGGIAQTLPETPNADLGIVIVKADPPTQSIGALLKVLKAERAKGPSGLQVGLPGGITVDVGPEPLKNDLPLHPDPLFLLLHIDEKRGLSLNHDKRGSLADLGPMRRRLGEIFKAREDTGVFRPETNEIEKTVSIRAHESLRVSDLDKVASMLDAAGSDRLILLIDPEPEPEEIILPPIPRNQKKKRKS